MCLSVFHGVSVAACPQLSTFYQLSSTSSNARGLRLCSMSLTTGRYVSMLIDLLINGNISDGSLGLINVVGALRRACWFA